MKTKTLKMKEVFTATPEEVYDALMSSKKHGEFTGDSAKISSKVGGKFTAYGDYISGVNLKLVPGKEIKQSWRASDWDEGAVSKVTYKFKKVKTGTEMTFIQEDLPADDFEDIKQGWVDYYWEPMKKYFEK